MSLRPFCGEYLCHATPLHLDLDRCSNNCWWCFANLNSPHRLADYGPLGAAIKSHLRREPPGKSLVKLFLNQGHPILVSNTSDPFAASTWPKFEPFWHACQDAGIPVCIQTRGGRAALATIAAARPTMVYVSITSDREDLLRKNEPGAPGFAERKELLLAAKDAGHFVVVALNPFYFPWWNDPMAFLQWMVDHGLRHAWFNTIHLSKIQLINLSARRRREEAKVISYAGKKLKPDSAALLCFMEEMDAAGINAMHQNTSRLGNWWEPYFALGFPFFPTLDGFFYHLRQAGGGQPVSFCFDYFDRWANPAPHFRASGCKDYLSSFGRSIRNTGQAAKAASFREVHAQYWRTWDYPTPLRHPDLYVATDGVDSKLVDGEGRPWWIYAPGHGYELVLPGSVAGTILT